jgi:hypothetical protein
VALKLICRYYRPGAYARVDRGVNLLGGLVVRKVLVADRLPEKHKRVACFFELRADDILI